MSVEVELHIFAVNSSRILTASEAYATAGPPPIRMATDMASIILLSRLTLEAE
ncbi:hypothetical protein [Desulfoscipio gibsoniae]|uniref:hypothetical protein n=1 Tax=Desulfoscipio gibsoniae TaxID=102134 RepID=UPI0002FE0BB0|nr:hypothetical protein [Desulfoscipio gibsoniae]